MHNKYIGKNDVNKQHQKIKSLLLKVHIDVYISRYFMYICVFSVMFYSMLSYLTINCEHFPNQ